MSHVTLRFINCPTLTKEEAHELLTKVWPRGAKLDLIEVHLDDDTTINYFLDNDMPIEYVGPFTDL